MSQPLALDSYRLLGRSGLRLSPLALGTMTFGNEYGWSTDEAEARRIFDRYVERGGNFIDTANMYTNGSSEKLVGQFAAHRRHRLVIATKYSLTDAPNDPNASGNHRKNMIRSVEGSLRRLNSDFIDLFYLHNWDFRTPNEEIMRGLDDLVRAGKIVYAAISNTPAWEVACMQTLAEMRGWTPLVAFQMQYSLVSRSAEREMIPMSLRLGLGVLPWSPLGGGVLTGKYTRADLAQTTDANFGSRKAIAKLLGTLSERNLATADAVIGIADEHERTPAQIALAWTLLNPAVTAPVIGARTLTQLDENLDCLGVQLSARQAAHLDEVSAIEMGSPHDELSGQYQQTLILGTNPIASRN
jgi:aryl-alcohol dehydrogenase-like predicted oxidoreductase